MIRRWEASSPPHPLSGAYLPRQERARTPGTIAVLRQDILLTPVLRRTSDLTETRPTPTDIGTGTAEIGGTGTEVGTTSVAEIMIAIGDVVVAEVEIEDVAEAETEGVTGVVTETVTGIENLIEIGKEKRSRSRSRSRSPRHKKSKKDKKERSDREDRESRDTPTKVKEEPKDKE